MTKDQANKPFMTGNAFLDPYHKTYERPILIQSCIFEWPQYWYVLEKSKWNADIEM